MDIYEKAYRKLHPKSHPYSPWERQMELKDLWPSDQQRFRDRIDAISETLDEARTQASTYPRAKG